MPETHRSTTESEPLRSTIGLSWVSHITISAKTGHWVPLRTCEDEEIVDGYMRRLLKPVSSVAGSTSYRFQSFVGLLRTYYLQLHVLIDASYELLQLDTLTYVAHIYPLSPPDDHPCEI